VGAKSLPNLEDQIIILWIIVQCCSCPVTSCVSDRVDRGLYPSTTFFCKRDYCKDDNRQLVDQAVGVLGNIATSFPYIGNPCLNTRCVIDR
jgi:hypothetical protein